MGINDRDYMRRRDPEPATRQLATSQGALLAICIVIGAVVIGNMVRRNLSERESNVEAIDTRQLEALLQTPEEPPVSIKRLVDINTATVKELDTLPYVGISTAMSIMNHRPYQSLDDLDRVPGIAKWKIYEIRPFATVGGP
jgi:DNA uptake protein ComE-like DNA-binding protein